jgi:kynurenine formamidase
MLRTPATAKAPFPLAVSTAFLLAACASAPRAAPPAAARAGAPALDQVRPVDLTRPFDARTLYWPTSPSAFELKRLHYGPTPGGYFYSANAFCAPEHGGTHLDAPLHFAESGWSAAQIPVDRLMGPAVVIDISSEANADADHRLTVQEVREWERKHGDVPTGAIVLLRTGWGRRWPDRRSYFGDDAPGDASHLHFPSYGKDAVEYLIRSRHVVALGVDTASIDYGPSKDFPVHRVLGQADVTGLENLAHLEEVPETGAWVIALPMKIAHGSGAPLRIVALVPR